MTLSNSAKSQHKTLQYNLNNCSTELHKEPSKFHKEKYLGFT